MPRKKNGLALRRWMRRAKKEHPNHWRPGVTPSERRAEGDFLARIESMNHPEGERRG